MYSRIEGEGKPLLILHGFLGMSDNWKTLGGKYAALGYEVHMPDMRNHGRSFHSDDFTYKAMSADITAYCQEKNLQNISLIGHSMGGKAAMFCAVENPSLIEKLVVADIGPKYYRQHHQDILEGLNAVDFSVKPDRSAVDEIIARHVPDEGTRQFLMKSLYWVSPGQLGFRFNLDVFNEYIENIGEALPSDAVYEGPTLFIKGGNSRYIKDEDAALISRQFPNSEIKEIPNTGHWLHAENPAAFLELTAAFLQAK